MSPVDENLPFDISVNRNWRKRRVWKSRCCQLS